MLNNLNCDKRKYIQWNEMLRKLNIRVIFKKKTNKG